MIDKWNESRKLAGIEARKDELDACAEERSGSLGKEHVTDGKQPYHADALTPDVHVPGSTPKCEPEAEAQGSGSERYQDAWDTGFAQDGDPYGIQAEYVSQSASPTAAIPTQEDADRVVAEAAAEMEARSNG
jgi:hypothetical protein